MSPAVVTDTHNDAQKEHQPYRFLYLLRYTFNFSICARLGPMVLSWRRAHGSNSSYLATGGNMLVSKEDQGGSAAETGTGAKAGVETEAGRSKNRSWDSCPQVV